MAHKFQQYPLYVYDEPITYSDFTGGINTDPSNEHLTANELRDCINFDFKSEALVKRKGASLLSTFVCEDELYNIQGIFLFTIRITFIIVAADGKLYKGFYSDSGTIKLERLKVLYYEDQSTKLNLYNPLNTFAGLPEHSVYNNQILHTGYIHSYTIDESGEEQDYNYRGIYNDSLIGNIFVDDVFEYYNNRYICLKQFDKTLITLDNTEYWKEIIYDETIDFIPWDSTTSVWLENTLVYYTDTKGYTNYYQCLKTYFNYSLITPLNTEYFKPLIYHKELIFQNSKKIEAATYANKLYIATGTRFIQVSFTNGTLIAQPVIPYVCNSNELQFIGYNYLSPYPIYCRNTQYNTVTTSIQGLLANKTIYGSYVLKPQMTFQYGEDEDNYYFRWEKRLNDGTWCLLNTFKAQINLSEGTVKPNLYTLQVNDADKFLYKVTFAKSFSKYLQYAKDWDYSTSYEVGDVVCVNNTSYYKCLVKHKPEDIKWVDDATYFVAVNPAYTKKTVSSSGEVTTTDIAEVTYWEILSKETPHKLLVDGKLKDITDWEPDNISGDAFGSATSVLWVEQKISSKYLTIQSCTKITIDGNKFLLYDDSYNSGEWFKTVISNPAYISNNGCLSFKTTKNEAIIKVVSFQGNLIVFANSENIGGSIHMVIGNGDDYNSNNGYFSPYRRFTKNTTISCDNPDTVQICENILVFKYFDTLYCISSSDLSNEIVEVISCNDRIKTHSDDVYIPWEDNSCVSLITQDYYALIWKEKYTMENGELYLVHPAMRVKMYYKRRNQIGTRYYMPWLRDESKYFNINNVIYVKGQPIYLYNNTLISFNNETYLDCDKSYDCLIKFKAVSIEAPKIYKFLSSIIVYSHRNHHSELDFDIVCKNEAGHLLYDSKNKKDLQDLKSLRAGDKNTGRYKLDSTCMDSKVFNVKYKFPFLLIDTEIKACNDKELSISSITYSYTTVDLPDTNPYDLYTSIIRK